MMVFWTEVNDCIRGLQEEWKVVITGNLNVKVGEEKLGNIVGGWGWKEEMRMKSSFLDKAECEERRMYLANIV